MLVSHTTLDLDQGSLFVLHIGSYVRIGSVFKCVSPTHKFHLQFSLHITSSKMSCCNCLDLFKQSPVSTLCPHFLSNISPGSILIHFDKAFENYPQHNLDSYCTTGFIHFPECNSNYFISSLKSYDASHLCPSLSYTEYRNVYQKLIT